MSTDPKQPPRALPHRPNLRHLKDQARDLVKAGTATSVTDAQFKIALLYGFPSWPKLKAYVESLDEIGRMKPALDTSDGVTGGNRALQLPVHTTEMYGAFSPDRSRLLTGGDGADPKVHIWDVETGRCLHELTGHKEPVAALGWSVDQQWIASGAFDQSIRLWDVRSGACLLSLEGHQPYVRSVDFGQSGEVLCQEAETAWSVSGRCQTGRRCRYWKGTRTASTMRFLMRAGAEPSQEDGTGRSDSGTSAQDAA